MSRSVSLGNTRFNFNSLVFQPLLTSNFEAILFSKKDKLYFIRS